VARDRQRAKARKARRGANNPGPAPRPLHRENVPGELDHASGEVDEFDAALVAGSGDEAAGADGDEPLATDGDEPLATDAADAEHPEELSEEDFEELEDEVDDRAEGRTPAPAAVVRAEVHPPGAPTKKGGPARFLAFLRASWAELQRVQWPDRRQVGQATAVVLGFVVVAGTYLGVADRVASELVDLII